MRPHGNLPRKTQPAFAALRSTAVILACLAYSGCNDEARLAEHAKRGHQFFSEESFDRAEIEYLNVIHLDPENEVAYARIGAIYFEQGRLGTAFPYLLRARELAPRDLETRLKLATLFLAGGNHQHAFEEAAYILEQHPENRDAPILLAEAASSGEAISEAKQRLLALSPVPTTRAPILVARGVLAVREGNHPDAKRLFEEALRIEPEFAMAYAGLGASHEGQGQLAEAGAAYERSAKLSPPASPLRLRYAQFKLQTRDFEGAKRVLDEILSASPKYLPAIVAQAEVAGASNQLDHSAALVQSALSLDAHNPQALLLSARLSLARKDSAKALATLEKYLELYPDSADGHIDAARVHLARKDALAARGSASRALFLSPHNPQAVLLLADLDIRQGNRGQAISALREMLEKHPSIIHAHLLLADAYQGQGELDEALAIYKRLESVSPDDDQMLHRQGMVYLLQKKPAAARAVFERAFARNPNSIATLERLINLDLAEKASDAALRRVQTALAARPRSGDLHVLLAKVQVARGDAARAEESLRQAVEFEPDHVIAYAMLAGRYVRSGDTARALESLKSVVDRNPQDIGAQMLAGMLHEQRGEFTQARDAYEKILAGNARFSPALNNLAYLYSEHLGDLERAHELARVARDVSPNDPYIADTLGWILYKRGEYEWARTLVQESAERLSSSPDVQYHLALAQYQQGDERAARYAFETALTLNANFSAANECRRHVAILNLDPAAPAPDAEVFLQRHLDERPNDPIALGRLAQLLKHKGQDDRALALQQRATQANPQNIHAQLALIRMHSERGETAAALEVARRARQMAPDNSDVAMSLGRLAFRSGDYPWAYSLFQETIRRHPRNPALLHDFANAAFSIGKVSECRGTLVRALELDGNAPTAAAARERVGLIDAAANFAPDPSWVHRAKLRLQSDPNDVAAMMVVAAAARDHGNTAAVRQTLEQALKIYPEFAPAKRQLTLLLAANPADDARTFELGKQAREAFPDDPLLAVALGKVSYRLGDHERTLSLLETAVPRLSSDATAWYCLGMAQAQLNHGNQARESLNKALGLGLTGDDANEARKRLAQVQ